METTICIDGKEVRFKATAAVPRLYRIKFGRDILLDMQFLRKELSETGTENSEEKKNLSVEALTMFESIAYIMAKHADPQGVPSTPDDWLDEFETFSVYKIFPEIFALWGANISAADLSKKKRANLRGK